MIIPPQFITSDVHAFINENRPNLKDFGSLANLRALTYLRNRGVEIHEQVE
jgi:hypothetical protein